MLSSHLIRERQNAFDCFVVRDTGGVNVRDQVAPRVGVAGARAMGEIRGQALGGREAGAFADQEHDDLWIELFADVVEHADSAVTHDERMTDLPATIRGRVEQLRQQRRD